MCVLQRAEPDLVVRPALFYWDETEAAREDDHLHESPSYRHPHLYELRAIDPEAKRSWLFDRNYISSSMSQLDINFTS